MAGVAAVIAAVRPAIRLASFCNRTDTRRKHAKIFAVFNSRQIATFRSVYFMIAVALCICVYIVAFH
jgi:hypothetical protein